MQYNKVEISGVNTGELMTLTEKQKLELLKRAHSGDKAARDKLIKGNLRLVLSVLQRFSGRSESPDDLFQVGVMGLIKAVDNFDTNLNVRFSTYAVPMIAGELRRHLRDYQAVRVPRSMKDLAYKAMQAREALRNERADEPTVEDIAGRIGEKRSAVAAAMESVAEPVSLYEPVCSESGDTLYLMDRVSDMTDDRSWLDEMSIKEALKKLDPRERSILFLRFFKGATQVEVAKAIGISQAQVSRLEKGALNNIKRGMH
ncbi:MAG: SigB/SigF/SigG family RNA polymerase sigma factor [Ruminococcus sp.]|nr:SigB/SigF/SigG family RNA polymerase sigma factor [Ruminococcus sp.]